MKNRILPFSFFLVAIGLTFFLFSSTFLHNQETSSTKNASYTNAAKVFKPAAQYLAKIRNNQVTGQIDFRDVVKAREQVEGLSASANRNEVLDWELLGPDNIAGRTRAIIFDSGDETANTLLAASVSGGIFKSTNLGLTWSKINGWDQALKVSCIVQDDQGNIYAGTGESFATEDFTSFGPLGYNGGFIGTGIYKSTDGENFSLLPNTKPTINSDTSGWAFINELAFDAAKGNLYASTNRGLRYSADGGVTWAFARTDAEFLVGNSFDVKIGTDGKIVTDIDNLCYVSSTGDPHLFMLKSRGDSASLPVDGIGRIEFAIAPSDPEVIYASIANDNGALDNIYVSEDGGNDWRIIAPGGTASLNIFGHGTEIGTGQGMYDNCITVFPDDPFRVIVGGINLWEGQKFNASGFYQWSQKSNSFTIPGFISGLHEDQHSIVFRPGFNNSFVVTNDGGVYTCIIGSQEYEYSSASKTYYSSQFYTTSYSGRKYKVIGGAQDNGVLTISGYGAAAIKKNGFELPLFGGDGGYSFISSISQDAYIASSHTTGTVSIRRTDDAAESYSNSFLPGAITFPANSFLLPSLLWEDFTNENSRDSVYFFSRQFSYGAGDQVPCFSRNLNYPFYHTLESPLGPQDSILVKDVVSTKFFLAIFDEVWMTTQAMDFTALPPEWYLISNNSEVGFEGTPQCIATSADANHAWVGTQEGRLFRISNIALAYDYDRADVNSPFCQISTTEVPVNVPGTSTPITQAITSISVDPNDSRHVIITLGNYGNTAYVLKSTNGLDQVPEFTSAQGNLPQMPVYASVIEMNNSNMAIIGTEFGTFVSQNVWASSPEWSQTIDENHEAIGETPVFMLRQQTNAQEDVPIWNYDGIDSTLVWYQGTDNYGVIYAASHGRGLYYNDQFQQPVGIGEPPIGIATAGTMVIYPNPVRDNAYLDIELLEASSVQVYIFDINGKLITQDNLSTQPAGLLHYEMNCNNLPSGTYFMRLVAGRTMETAKFIVYK